MSKEATRQFRLAFIQIVCPSYKLALYEGIHNLPGVELDLFIGDKHPPSIAPGCIPYSCSYVQIRNTIFTIFGITWIWQHLGRVFSPRGYDLVILPDGVFFLSNYVIMLRCWLKGVPFAFYTHGYNYQRKLSPLARYLECFRGFVHRRSDLLIVYSEEGARHLHEKSRVAYERIFVSKNTLDVDSIIERSKSFTSSIIAKRRYELGASKDDIILVYIGRLVPQKNPGWVIDVVARLRASGEPVRAVFVGNGVSMPVLRRHLAKLPEDVQDAVRFAGEKSIDEVDLYLKAGDITVMPGMTGLAIAHSFALGRPYITIKSPYHSPEIAYLEEGVNALIADNNIDSFSEAVLSLVSDPKKRESMANAAFDYAVKELTMDYQLKGFKEAIDYIRQRG